MFGPPKDVEGECNARLKLADDYGDNAGTFRCQLLPGHEGPHKETFRRDSSGQVNVTWEEDERKSCVECGAFLKPGEYEFIEDNGEFFDICDTCYENLPEDQKW